MTPAESPIDTKRIERAIAVLCLGLVAAGCLVTVWPFLTPLIWAVIITFSTWPLYSRLERALGGRATLAAILMALATAIILVAPIALFALTLGDDVANLFGLLRQWLQVGPPGPPEWVAGLPLVGPSISERWQQIAADGTSFTAALMPYLGALRGALLAAGASLGGGIAALLLSLILACFLYINGEALARRLHTGVERIGGARGDHLAKVAQDTVRGVVYGVLGANLIQSVVAVIGFLLAGIPGAVLLGMLSFFLTLVPGGPTLLWLPAVIWLIVDGNIGWGIFLAVWSVLNYGLLENVLRLYMIGRSSELPMLVLLLGILGGLIAFGLLGLLIGPALLAVGFALVSEWSAAPPVPQASGAAAATGREQPAE
jgi:predicted PurR-regulated permease PerM